MADSERSHLLVNSEIETSQPGEDTPDITLYQDKEVKRKLKVKDYVNILILVLDIICHGMGYALISSYYPITVIFLKNLSKLITCRSQLYD